MTKFFYLFLCILLGLCSASACFAACTATGPYTIDCNGVTYRAVDDECVYYVDLAAFNAQHPGVPLPSIKKTIADNYNVNAVPDPVVVELTDYVDCTGTSHNFQDANLCPYASHPNKPSRIMTISGKQFRVTAAPDDGFATYYYSFDVQTGGQAGVPHVLVAESSNDQERYTTISINHPDDIIYGPAQPWAPPYTYKPENPNQLEPTINPWGDPWYDKNMGPTQQGPVFGCDVGVASYTGRELPIDNRPYNIAMTFYSKTATTRVLVSSLGCTQYRSGTDGGAVSKMWVFAQQGAVSNASPQIVVPDDPAEQRHIGIHVTHPWYLYAHYGTPVRLLSQRQQDLQRMVDHLKFCGFDYLVFNAINGSDRAGKAWYPGSAYYPWNSAGDLLSELPPIAESAGIKLVPVITSLAEVGGFTNTSYQMGTDGDYTRAFGTRVPDPLRPEVQQVVFNLLSEIASRCASSSAVRGIGIRVNGKIGTCYTADDDGSRGAKLSGYSSWDLQQFKADTGSGVPTSPPSTAYSWLQARPAEWESWLNWRCQRTRNFWLACRDLIKSYRSDLIFYVQCDLPSETPGTNIEWPTESPRNLLRHHGYDPDMLASDTGIVVTRGMMVAEDRFYSSSRWGPPWGANSDNYRTFHYAPGLAEMYRTAQGKACDFYQNYWEEHQNPYWEFGSCGSAGVYFRTTTPAAPGRSFFTGASMSMRRQDPDTMTWLGWYRPTLGHEADLRKFAQAYRALPVIAPTAFSGTIEPAMTEVVARWYRDRLAVINDTSTSRTVTLHFASPLPMGYRLTDVVTGRDLISANQLERQNVSFGAEAYSLNTFLQVEPTGPRADFTTDSLPIEPPLTVQFHDTSVADGITSWDWDFGDGSAHGSGPNPAHAYSSFGTYDVTLTVTYSGGTLSVTRPLELVGVPPTVAGVSPAKGASVGRLASISVTFTKGVTGVSAADMTVNGSPATAVFGSGAGPYWFSGFAAPSAGTAAISLSAGGIHDAGGAAFAGDQWTCTILPAPKPGVDNPSFELNGGSYDGWEIVHVTGEWPDNPPLSNSNQWGVTTPYGTHFGGKITNGLRLDFYLGQVVGISNWDPLAVSANWQMSGYAQLKCTQAGAPNPTGVHQVWEIGWNDDGSEPTGIASCDHYQAVASFDGNYTNNDSGFHPVSGSGTISFNQGELWKNGLRGVALRVHLYNDNNWWWTFANIDNVSLQLTSGSGATISDAKALPDGTAVALRGKPVTAAWADDLYIEEADRSCGVRVLSPAHGLFAGMTADVVGTLRTSGGERYIEASGVAPNSSMSVRPLFVINRSLAGGDWGYQGGVVGGYGLNNIGLLVCTIGRVVDVGLDYFTIDDGSMPGAPVKVLAPGLAPPPAGSTVGVTGVSSCEETGGGRRPVVRVRTQDDILPI